MPRVRLFLDANVLVSAVLFDGIPGRIVDAVRDGRVEGVVSLHVLAEFTEVLTRLRFGIDEATALALAEEIASFTEVVPLTSSSGSWVTDRGDDPVVAAALLGKVTHLVTGDARIHEAVIGDFIVALPADAVRLCEETATG